VRERLRHRAVLLIALVAVGLAVLGTYTWMQTARTRCPATGVCLVTKTHHVHPLRARIEWAGAVVAVIGAASLAMSGRRRNGRGL
jgi:hypothetical protein